MDGKVSLCDFHAFTSVKMKEQTTELQEKFQKHCIVSIFTLQLFGLEGYFYTAQSGRAAGSRLCETTGWIYIGRSSMELCRPVVV